MSSRTEEQVAADKQLTEAIEAVQRAYNDEVEGVLTKYVVLAQRTWWDEDGDSATASYAMPMDNDVPISDLIGMVEYASTVFRRRIASEE